MYHMKSKLANSTSPKFENIWRKSTNSISIKRYEEEEDEDEEEDGGGDDQKNQKCRFFQNERTFNPNDYK